MTLATKARALELLKAWKYKSWQLKAFKLDEDTITCIGWGKENKWSGQDKDGKTIDVIASNDSQCFKISKAMAKELVGPYSSDKELSAKLFTLV